jgi:UDP-N-acetylenolpyruvoylglucosamine reductase
MTTVFSSNGNASKEDVLKQLNHIFDQVAKQTGVNIKCLSETFQDLNKTT